MKSLKLNQLTKASLSKREMNHLRGGEGDCCCSCWAQNSGGSSTNANMDANIANDLTSIHGCIEEVKVNG